MATGAPKWMCVGPVAGSRSRPDLTTGTAFPAGGRRVGVRGLYTCVDADARNAVLNRNRGVFKREADFCREMGFVSLLRKAWEGFGVEVLVNVVLPYLIYVKAEAGIGRVHALMASSLPPITWAAIQLARKRRVDALSLLVISGIALSLIAFLGGGSVKFLQLREHLVSGVIGVVFLGSAAIRRPLIYELARATMGRKSQAEAERIEQYRDNPQFRRAMMIMTVVWGFGLLAQTGVASFLIFEMPIREFLIVGPIVGYLFAGTLVLWTFWYGKRRKRRSAAQGHKANA